MPDSEYITRAPGRLRSRDKTDILSSRTIDQHPERDILKTMKDDCFSRRFRKDLVYLFLLLSNLPLISKKKGGGLVIEASLRLTGS